MTKVHNFRLADYIGAFEVMLNDGIRIAWCHQYRIRFMEVHFGLVDLISK
jgi:hypothetical protein